jgi:hypothetical protein
VEKDLGLRRGLPFWSRLPAEIQPFPFCQVRWRARLGDRSRSGFLTPRIIQPSGLPRLPSPRPFDLSRIRLTMWHLGVGLCQPRGKRFVLPWNDPEAFVTQKNFLQSPDSGSPASPSESAHGTDGQTVGD